MVIGELIETGKEFHPLRDLRRVRESMRQALDELREGRRVRMMDGDGADFEPAVDILETDEEYVVRAALPGVAKQEIHVEISGTALTLRGARKLREDEGMRCLRREQAYGEFRRVFELPEEVDARAIKAHDKDGELEIRLPKSQKGRGKSIKVD